MQKLDVAEISEDIASQIRTYDCTKIHGAAPTFPLVVTNHRPAPVAIPVFITE